MSLTRDVIGIQLGVLAVHGESLYGGCRIVVELIYLFLQWFAHSLYTSPTMSVSSVASNATVGFHGRSVGMEEALDEVVRRLQNHMNHVQLALRQVACVAEQDLDYEEELKLSWGIDEDLLQMGFLFDDLRAMCLDLITVPETPEEKALAKKFKIDRKEYEKKAIAEHVERFKLEREASKAALAAERANAMQE